MSRPRLWMREQSPSAKNYVEYGMAKMEIERLEGASTPAVK